MYSKKDQTAILTIKGLFDGQTITVTYDDYDDGVSLSDVTVGSTNLDASYLADWVKTRIIREIETNLVCEREEALTNAIHNRDFQSWYDNLPSEGGR